jgi:hypothetical protein
MDLSALPSLKGINQTKLNIQPCHHPVRLFFVVLSINIGPCMRCAGMAKPLLSRLDPAGFLVISFPTESGQIQYYRWNRRHRQRRFLPCYAIPRIHNLVAISSGRSPGQHHDGTPSVWLSRTRVFGYQAKVWSRQTSFCPGEINSSHAALYFNLRGADSVCLSPDSLSLILLAEGR